MDKLNLSGQIVHSLTSYLFSITYKPPDKRAGQIQFVRVLKIKRKHLHLPMFPKLRHDVTSEASRRSNRRVTT